MFDGASLRRSTVTATAAGLPILAVGGVAWLAGEPFVFPSLGPTAYALATREDGPAPGDVFWAHVVGLVAGLAAFHGVVGADGGSLAGFRALTAGDRGALALAGTLAVAGTTAGMLASGRRHAPACATTLIVALGLLTSARDAVVVVLAVVAVLAVATVGDAVRDRVWVGRRR